MRRAAVLLILVLLTVAPAHAKSQIAAAGRALRADPVFVAAEADPTITPAEARSLREQIDRVRVAVFVAVLPVTALEEVESTDALPRALADATGRKGAYAVIAGRNFRAAASTGIGLSRGEAGRLADDAFEQNHPADNAGRVYPMLADWVRRIDDATRPAASRPVEQEDPATSPPRYRDAVPDDDPAIVVRNPGAPTYPVGGPSGDSIGAGIFIFLIALLVAGVVIGRATGRRYPRSPGRLDRADHDDAGFTPAVLTGAFLGSRDRADDDDSPFDRRSDSGGGSWGSIGSSSSSSSDGDDSPGSSSSGGSSFDDDKDSGGGSW